MLCELSQIQLKSVAVGQKRLSRMTAFELKEHDERINKVVEQCKAREPHKFWSQDEVYQRASKWRGNQYERRMTAELKLEQSKQRGGNGSRVY